MNKIIFLIFFAFFSLTLHAADNLFFIEAQGVIGYSSMDDGIIYRSGHAEDVMQKNSLGVDYIQKFSGETQDVGTLFLQGRVAFDEDKGEVQAQLYNAYFKVKTPITNIWAGHNRIAFGLSSYWDTHGDLLQALPMYGFNFDRDWGIGSTTDTENGDLQIALSTGTGMDLNFKGNWLATSRASLGVLSYDNYNVGLSIMGGKIFDNIGYEIIGDKPKGVIVVGADFAYNHDSFEHKVEVDVGEKNKNFSLSGFYRLSINFLEENRFKLETQYVYVSQEKMHNNYVAAGMSYRITSDVATRIMYEWQGGEMDSNKVIAQVYYYSAL
jgi:hypothetical protein